MGSFKVNFITLSGTNSNYLLSVRQHLSTRSCSRQKSNRSSHRPEKKINQLNSVLGQSGRSVGVESRRSARMNVGRNLKNWTCQKTKNGRSAKLSDSKGDYWTVERSETGRSKWSRLPNYNFNFFRDWVRMLLTSGLYCKQNPWIFSLMTSKFHFNSTLK